MSRAAAAETAAAVDVAAAAQLACLLEASAPKPGNVSPGRHYADARYEDFLASAVAIGTPLAEAGTRPLGATVRLAVEATSRWTRSNTNLGIVLLLAPLARAALLGTADGPDPDVASRRGAPAWARLRARLRLVLEEAGVDDARAVYQAIRQAAPGGLGRVEAEDVSGEPTSTLFEVMRLAAHRDTVAREYVSAFETTFTVGTPALARARNDGLAWDAAVVETFLVLLQAAPDTHIARRHGPALAAEVSRRATAVLAAGGVRSEQGLAALDEMDRALRDARGASSGANPGATADLTAAAIFVVLLGGGWPAGHASHGGRHAAAR
jgi:triphosphoribosyl-dephospho-CoA synthase